MSPLQRLYRSELVLLAVGLASVGLALLVLAHMVQGHTGLASLGDILREVASTMFGGGIVLVGVEYVDRKVGENRLGQEFRTIVRQEAPAIRDAVIRGFAFDADDLARVSSPAVLDDIARNVLAIQLGDRDLAANAYDELRSQVIQAPERWHDVTISVALAPWAGEAAGTSDPMFVATVRWEYRTVPAWPAVRFVCVSDKAEYRDLLRDPTIASAWYFSPAKGVDAASPDAYELIEFAMNGRPRPTRRTQRAGAQTYTAMLPPAVAGRQEVTLSCTYRVLVKRHGHLLYLDLPRPAKGLQVNFAYGGCGIRAVNALDFVGSPELVRTSRTPATGPSPSVEIRFDGWTFPRSGIAFVWSLENELPASRRRAAPKTPRSTPPATQP